MDIIMKYVFTLLTACTLPLLAASNSAMAAKSPERVAQKVAEALIKNNKTDFDKLIINREDAIGLFEKAAAFKKKKVRVEYRKLDMAEVTMLEREVSNIKSNKSKLLAGIQSQVKTSFTLIRKKADVELAGFKHAKFGKVLQVKKVEAEGNTQYDIFFTVVNNKEVYNFIIDDATQTPRGFVLMGKVIWKGKATK